MLERLSSTYTADSLYRLYESCVCIVGLGGGGCVLAELLARHGVGNFILVDGDTYDDSNKNRQLYAVASTLGQNKAKVAAQRLQDINPRIRTVVHPEFISESNYAKILYDFESMIPAVVCDAVDGSHNKSMLADFCQRFDLPYTTGGCGGYYGWTAPIHRPNEISTRDLLGTKGIRVEDIDKSMSPSPSPTTVFIQAALQAQETINMILERDWNTEGKRIGMNLMSYALSVVQVPS